MKRLSILCGLFLVLTTGANLASAQTIQYSFSPTDTTIGCGDTLVVDVGIDTVTDLLGYSLQLNYDQAVLSPVSADTAGLVANAPCGNFFRWLNSGSNDGTVKVDLAMLGCTITGSGDLFRVKFVGLKSGANPFTSSLTTTGTMRDSNNGAISFSDAATAPTVTTNCNNAPVLGAIGNQSVDEEVLLTFTAIATDVDIPADVLTFSLTGGVAGMNLTTGGVFTWTPTEAQGPGTYPVTVTVSDGTTTDDETFDIVVAEVNNDPVLAAIGNQSVDEEVLLTFTAIATDVDLPANTLTFSLTGGVAGMNLTTGGVFTWTPTEAQGPGTYPVTVTVSDGTTTDDETFDIVVAEVNNDPVLAAIGNQSVDEEVLLTFTAIATDVDLPANTLTFSLTGGVAGMNLTTGGVFTWTPTEAQGPGTYPVTVTVSDGTTTDDETFDIVVAEVNNDPVLAAIGNQSVDEEVLLTFTAIATDVDLPANTLTFSLTGGVAGMNLTTGGVFTWTPTEAQGPGTYPVTVTVSDGTTTDDETFDIVVAEVNNDPVLAAIGNQSVDEEVLLTFTAIATDVDLPANTLTFSLTGGVAGMNLTTGGVFTWTPTEAQGPGTYPVTVTVSDGTTTDDETFDIVVAEVNNDPVLAAIGNQSVDEEVLLTFTAIATDVDLPANTLTFSLTGGVAGMNLTTGGVFTWTPTEAQGPGTYPVTVTVSDGTTTDDETFDIVVAEVNNDPVLAAIGNQSVDEEVLLTFTAIATDVDLPANTLTFSLTGGVAGMNLTTGGVFTWTPTEAQGPGTYPVTVTVSDGTTTDDETFDIVVAEVNNDPVLAAIGNQSVDEEVLLTFTAIATDVDLPANTLTFSLTGGVAGMNLTTGGVFTWTPTEAQGPGTYPVTVTVSDGTTTDDETFDIVVAEVNNDPVLAAIGNQSVDEEVLLTFTAIATDVDLPANTLTFSLTGGVAGMNLTTGGVFTWTPTEAQGPGTYPVTVTVSDGTTTDDETFDIVVAEVNNDPVLAAIGNQSVDEEVLLTFTAIATDVDLPANTLTFSLTGGVAGMNLTTGGVFTWTPTEAQGPGTYPVTVTVSDGTTTDDETFDIVVAEVNNDPVLAAIGNQSVDEEVLLTFTAIATDVDLPANTLTFSLTGGVAGMNLTTGGVFTWTPTEAQGPGTYPVTVTVSDGTTTDDETFDIVVNEVNLPPVVTNPGAQTSDELDVISLAIAATDPDGNTLAYEATNLPGSLTIDSGSGVISGTIDCGASSGSPYSVTVTVIDNGSPVDSTEVTFSWTVDPLPTPAAVTSLTATQVKSGNDGDGTTKITITWSGSVTAGNTVEVYRKGFGNYPEYDDAPGAGSVPAAPTTTALAVAGGWTLTGVSSSGGTDEVATRDFWYYVAFVKNPCDAESPASNMTSGTLNYHLGDVVPVAVPPAVLGDNAVNLLDISKLGNHYGTSDGDSLYADTLDVGPTTDMSVNARPTTDDEIQFEDLILFSINFQVVSKPGGPLPTASGLAPVAAELNALTVRIPAQFPHPGETFTAELELASDGSIQGVSIPLRWDPEIVEPIGFSSGKLMQSQMGQAAVLSPRPGTVDAVVFGSPIIGEGLLATVTFQVKEVGDPALGVDDLCVRDAFNRPISLAVEVARERNVGVIPTVTRLLPSAPNPFFATTNIRFDLALDGNVDLRIFGVDGRLVRTLIREHTLAGTYNLQWDGHDDSGRPVASGLYLMRLATPTMTETRRMVRLR